MGTRKGLNTFGETNRACDEMQILMQVLSEIRFKDLIVVRTFSLIGLLGIYYNKGPWQS